MVERAGYDLHTTHFSMWLILFIWNYRFNDTGAIEMSELITGKTSTVLVQQQEPI